MRSREFLLNGGIILVMLAILGVYGLGSTESKSALGSFFWLDNFENYLHLLFGVWALLTYLFLKSKQLIWVTAILIGSFSLLIALIGLLNAHGYLPFMGNNTTLMTLEKPADYSLHLVIAFWAIYSSFRDFRAKAYID